MAQSRNHVRSSGALLLPLAATAFGTLGKFCLASSELTKRLLPVFVRELSFHPAAAVRHNCLLVLHDLARQHTSLLDRHVPVMALALGDASASLGLISTLVFGMGISFMFELPLTGSWLNVFEFICVVLSSACSAFVLSFALLEHYYVCEALWGSN